uniref:Uncharacterized protein n=1 Tax=Candidatus Kentrum eta TaxID=2126337 RepID=A0A450UFU4_9GAMM|nr:MAG: hypothetical protein BECKH772A_GA0070896_1003116 [Candidatus Kentron sp. H]VFJ92495.1 MAG: hypothetical protein BECKH772B_GA0070898_1003017 [Candidatus Kentron sp. H]VFJ99281.1 MAG: hypothetical protein BECKH772C_GA0070978_1003016 [Candidatus Kentron sp. H]
MNPSDLADRIEKNELEKKYSGIKSCCQQVLKKMDLGKLNSTTKITHEQILKQGDRLGDLGKELIKIELIVPGVY